MFVYLRPLHQSLDRVLVPRIDGVVKRRGAISVLAEVARLAVEQGTTDLGLAEDRRPVERGAEVVVKGVDLDAVVGEEGLHDRFVAVGDG